MKTIELKTEDVLTLVSLLRGPFHDEMTSSQRVQLFKTHDEVMKSLKQEGSPIVKYLKLDVEDVKIINLILSFYGNDADTLREFREMFAKLEKLFTI